jgi:hypothetical protein
VLELGVLIVRVHPDDFEEQIDVLNGIHGITLVKRRATGRYDSADRGWNVGVFQKT